MVDKRVIIAGVLMIFVTLAVAVSVISDDGSGVATPNAKAPPEAQPIPETTTAQVLTLADDTGDIICQQPPKGNEYGGIGGSENDPPNGTVIDPNLTKNYGRPTAIGTCGTYWHIVGWWFNASEMAKLPQETIMYGVSPYAITSGDDNKGSAGNGDDGPITPVPELSTIVLTSAGILGLFLIARKYRKN